MGPLPIDVVNGVHSFLLFLFSLLSNPFSSSSYLLCLSLYLCLCLFCLLIYVLRLRLPTNHIPPFLLLLLLQKLTSGQSARTQTKKGKNFPFSCCKKKDTTFPFRSKVKPTQMLTQEEHTSCMDMSVLERQAARFKWLLLQQQQQSKDTFIMNPQYGNHVLFPSGFEFLSPDQIASHRRHPSSCSLEVDHCLSRSSSSLDGSNKRKPEIEECRENKRVKGETEMMECSSETRKNCTESSKRDSGAEKSEYIHVRARRGQATDSHSLAERARREKISRKMKYLQDLVPGCNKITGRAGMLDEIINYVQSLQRQVEFLSMKLAAVNPGVEFIPDLCVDSSCYPVVNLQHIQAQPFWEADSQSFQDMGFHHQG